MKNETKGKIATTTSQIKGFLHVNASILKRQGVFCKERENKKMKRYENGSAKKEQPILYLTTGSRNEEK